MNSTGLDKQNFSAQNCKYFCPSILTYVLGAQKNRLIETILLSTQKELSHWDSSFEYPQHKFWLKNKKIKFSLRTLN